jgi:hypothetical protein
MVRTSTLPGEQLLDRLLNPIRDALTPDVARAIVGLRADPAIQAMIEDYGERHHEGLLAPEELSQYEAMVHATNLIAVLQAKARTVLTPRPAP